MSGDARRALDICRRATELAQADATSKQRLVGMSHVDSAVHEMFSSSKIMAIRCVLVCICMHVCVHHTCVYVCVYVSVDECEATPVVTMSYYPCRHASFHEKMFLRAVLSAFRSSGIEETTFKQVLVVARQPLRGLRHWKR